MLNRVSAQIKKKQDLSNVHILTLLTIGSNSQPKKDSWRRHTCDGSVIIERLGALLSACMQTARPGSEEAGITHVVSFLKWQHLTVARDESIPRVVSWAKLAKTIAEAGKYFMGQLSKSMKY